MTASDAYTSSPTPTAYVTPVSPTYGQLFGQVRDLCGQSAVDLDLSRDLTRLMWRSDQGLTARRLAEFFHQYPDISEAQADALSKQLLETHGELVASRLVEKRGTRRRLQ